MFDSKVTLMAGMMLEAFRKPANKAGLRSRVSHATSLFSKEKIGRADLHPLLNAQVELAMRYQVAV